MRYPGNTGVLLAEPLKVGVMKSVHKSQGLTVKLSREERVRLRKAADLETRRLRRTVSSGEILREAGLARAAEILQAAAQVEVPAESAVA